MNEGPEAYGFGSFVFDKISINKACAQSHNTLTEQG